MNHLPASPSEKSPPKKEPWRRIKFPLLVQLLNRKNRPWRWYVTASLAKPERKHLQVVSPYGQHWDFKLSGGAWLRKAPSPCPDKPSTS